MLAPTPLIPIFFQNEHNPEGNLLIIVFTVVNYFIDDYATMLYPLTILINGQAVINFKKPV